jgi:hypothetical protein
VRASDRSLQEPEVGSFNLFTRDPDLQAIVWVMHEIQMRASASTEILYNYGNLINNVISLGLSEDISG